MMPHLAWATKRMELLHLQWEIFWEFQVFGCGKRSQDSVLETRTLRILFKMQVEMLVSH